jgi:hypothetical protein
VASWIKLQAPPIRFHHFLVRLEWSFGLNQERFIIRPMQEWHKSLASSAVISNFVMSDAPGLKVCRLRDDLWLVRYETNSRHSSYKKELAERLGLETHERKILGSNRSISATSFMKQIKGVLFRVYRCKTNYIAGNVLLFV